MPPVRLSALFLVALLGASCGVPKSQNCSLKPVAFLDWSDPQLKYHPAMINIAGPQKNVIKIARSGAVTWNGVDVTTLHGFALTLESYLDRVSQMVPQPLTALDFDKGAPCETIETVRALMMKHLNCTQSQSCLQGSGLSGI